MHLNLITEDEDYNQDDHINFELLRFPFAH